VDHGRYATAAAIEVTRVCVAARVRMYRQGITEHLRRRSHCEVVAAAHDWETCLKVARETRPHVVVLDLALPADLDDLGELFEAAPGVKVLGLAVESVDDALACAEAGIAGYVTCNDSLADLVARIEDVRRGEMPCTPEVSGRLFERIADLRRGARAGEGTNRLTPREREIVGLVEAGMSNKEIAAALRIELATVKNHVHNILEKLGARRRGEVGLHVHGAAPRASTREI
jgi:two-component system, NarL family, nitrate/nitrite response regulator NarL